MKGTRVDMLRRRMAIDAGLCIERRVQAEISSCIAGIYVYMLQSVRCRRIVWRRQIYKEASSSGRGELDADESLISEDY